MKIRTIILFSALVVIFLIAVTIAGFYFLKMQTSTQGLSGQPGANEETTNKSTAVETFVKPTGWFKSGQEADLILGPLEMAESGGSSQLHHPAKVFYDGQKLFVSDTRNHRVLIWNSLPAYNAQPADVVVGQKDMRVAASGAGSDKLNWPLGVYSDEKRLFVADADNERVLIWNSIPTQNGVSADIVLGQPDFNHVQVPQGKDSSSHYITWPWDITVVNGKLVVVGGNKAMIWNKIPESSFTPADLVLGQPYFSEEHADNSALPDKARLYTARCVASDGQKLVIGDYNGDRLLIWNSFPTQNGQAADIEIKGYEMGCSLTKNGMLFASKHLGPSVGFWKTAPTKDNQEPDIIIGLNQTLPHLSGISLNQPWGVFSDGARVFIADTNANRVVIHNKIPVKDEEPADIVLGEKDFNSSIFAGRNGMESVASIGTDGKNLWVGYWNRILFWNPLPQKSSAPADGILIYPDFGPQDNRRGDFFTDEASAIIPYNGKLIVVSREQNRILIWNKYPTRNRQKHDLYLGKGVVYDEAGNKNFPGGCGITQMNQPQGGAASQDGRLFVADTSNRRILIWNSIPSKNETLPDLVIGQTGFETCNEEAVPDTTGKKINQPLNRFTNPTSLSIDGERMVVLDGENRRALVWNKLPTRNDQPADYELTEFQNPAGGETIKVGIAPNILASHGHLFLAADNNRVLAWKNFPERDGIPPDIVLGQPDWNATTPGRGKDKIKMPKALAFDGSYLWVGEFKFADRLLRFSVQTEK